jgi:hypothetical protein
MDGAREVSVGVCPAEVAAELGRGRSPGDLADVVRGGDAHGADVDDLLRAAFRPSGRLAIPGSIIELPFAK